MANPKSKVKRAPKRGIYEREKIYALLDREFLCHVAFQYEDYPVVIPTMYGRRDDHLYIHGASVSRLVNELERGIPVCVSVANVSGIVLARSAFHHSLNYESVVLFGKGRLVEGAEKENALRIISEQVLPGRWSEVRLPTAKELKATKVIRIDIEEASGKMRTGDPVDEREDYDLPVWAGLLPVERHFGSPRADARLSPDIELPASVRKAVLPGSTPTT